MTVVENFFSNVLKGFWKEPIDQFVVDRVSRRRAGYRLLGAGILRDGLGTLGDGVLRELSR